MARVSQCDKLPAQDRMLLIARIADGASWRVVAHEFSLPVETIRQWAERNGYGRSPVEAKRKAVDELLAKDVPFDPGLQPGQRPDTITVDISAAVERDAKVAKLAAGVAVQILRRLATLAQAGNTLARDTVAIATALDKAWGTYARINKLDDPAPDNGADLAALAADARRRLGI